MHKTSLSNRRHGTEPCRALGYLRLGAWIGIGTSPGALMAGAGVAGVCVSLVVIMVASGIDPGSMKHQKGLRSSSLPL